MGERYTLHVYGFSLRFRISWTLNGQVTKYALDMDLYYLISFGHVAWVTIKQNIQPGYPLVFTKKHSCQLCAYYFSRSSKSPHSLVSGWSLDSERTYNTGFFFSHNWSLTVRVGFHAPLHIYSDFAWHPSSILTHLSLYLIEYSASIGCLL